jgi:hypothetical protein
MSWNGSLVDRLDQVLLIARMLSRRVAVHRTRAGMTQRRVAPQIIFSQCLQSYVQIITACRTARSLRCIV